MDDDDADMTIWVERMHQDDPRAFEKIWEGFFERLSHYARRKLGEAHRRDYDEDDAALSAMNSLFRGVREKRFENLKNSEDLWRLLVTIGGRKVRAQLRKRFSDKRGSGEAAGESIFERKATVDGPKSFDQMIHDRPEAELEAIVADEIEALLGKLGDEATRQVLVMKLEGYTNEEVAAQTGCSLRSVERKLNRLREGLSTPEESA